MAYILTMMVFFFLKQSWVIYMDEVLVLFNEKNRLAA